MAVFGGNRVEKYHLKEAQELLFENQPYLYKLLRLDGTSSFSTDFLRSFTIYIYQASQPIQLRDSSARSFSLSEGDALQVENQNIELSGKGTLLISGIRSAVFPTTSLKLTVNDEIKKVAKHWGHELWLNGEHPGYAFKQIYLKAGTKTSLQYHRLKSETNILFEGTGKLYFKVTDKENDSVTVNDLGSTELQPGTIVSVSPMTLHRIEAISDLILYEVSTPHLDDVVRIADDQNRPSGRIESEHLGRTQEISN